MNEIAAWSLVIGVTATVTAMGRNWFKCLPISLPFFYLSIGVAISPLGLDMLSIDLLKDAKTIETLAEIAVLSSLYIAGVKLKPEPRRLLSAPLLLATASMMLTVAGICVLGVLLLDLPLGVALLLGAVLAPTDPVLAGAVNVKHEKDTDTLRYTLTGEAGMNDGTAFPFIMLALGLIGVHHIGPFGSRWLVVDVAWAVSAAIAIGFAVGWLACRALIFAKRISHRLESYEVMISIGIVGLSYGLAMAVNTYGFLAVFAAGAAVRICLDTEMASSHRNKMVAEVLKVNEQIGYIIEIALMIFMGVLLSVIRLDMQFALFAVALFLIIRPLSVLIGLLPSTMERGHKFMVCFFGIRGVGSVYYLAFAINHGLPEQYALPLTSVVLTTIAFSLLIHSNNASLILDVFNKRK